MIDPRLQMQKDYPRAMRSYVMMLYEFVLELRPAKMLEVGVQNGQSTKTILMAMNELAKYCRFSSHLVSVDIKRRQDILQQHYPDLYEYWTFIQGRSQAPETIEQVRATLGEGEYFDLLFIDGDHSYEGAKQDFDNYSQLIKPGGLIFLHDTVNTNEGVRDLWKEITWEKFNLDWGWARSVTPGFGIVRKPNETES